MSVGVALIVRDEAASLAARLETIRAGVDEIVVVDTGSVDATVEIARGFTDRFSGVISSASSQVLGQRQCFEQ